MRLRKIFLTMGLVLAIAAFVAPSTNALSATGTVAVTATTVASVSLTFVTDGAGITLGGTGTSAATIAFGSVQAYGGFVPSHITQTAKGILNWVFRTPVQCVVGVCNPHRSNQTPPP